MEEYLSDSAAPIRLVPAGCLPQTVRKVLTRLKYSVLLYKAESGFSILTEEYLTFLTGSPNEAGRIYAYNEQQRRLSCSLLFHVFFVVSIMKHQFLKPLTLEILSLSVNRWGFTDKLLILNNLSGRRRVFTDKIRFCETTINRHSRGAHKKMRCATKNGTTQN